MRVCWLTFLLTPYISFASSDRGGHRTDAVLILHDGKKVFESYERGHNKEMKHVTWSISKTVMALLYGVALAEKRISLDESVCKYDEFSNKKFCDITLKQLLQWSTGIQWVEEYEKSGRPRAASILAMAYGEGRGDMVQFVKQQPIAATPGTSWRYSSGDSMLASQLLKQIFNSKDVISIFKEKIADPIELKNWTWETDPQGTIAGSYYFYSSTEDMARIGELILNEGLWNGKQILAKEFVAFMKSMPAAYKSNPQALDKNFISGSHIWLNDPKDTGLSVPWPTAPIDTIAAAGHWGQYLVIIPSLKTVGVRFGDCRDSSYKLIDFVTQMTTAGQAQK